MRYPRMRISGIVAAGLIVIAGMSCSTGCGSLLGQFFAEVAVSTHELTFEATEGENPEDQQIIAYCTITDFDPFVEYGCTADITTNQPWLSTQPTSFYGQDTVTISVDTEGLEPGEHLGRVHVEYILVSIDDEEDVNVTLTINPDPNVENELEHIDITE